MRPPYRAGIRQPASGKSSTPMKNALKNLENSGTGFCSRRRMNADDDPNLRPVSDFNRAAGLDCATGFQHCGCGALEFSGAGKLLAVGKCPIMGSRPVFLNSRLLLSGSVTLGALEWSRAVIVDVALFGPSDLPGSKAQYASLYRSKRIVTQENVAPALFNRCVAIPEGRESWLNGSGVQ